MTAHASAPRACASPASPVGGDGVAREPSGRVPFVRGALPGELVVAEVVEEHPRHARAVAVDVVEPSPDRVAPPCRSWPPAAVGCGWQHVDPAAQRELKAARWSPTPWAAWRRRRAGGRPGPPLPGRGYRTTMRAVADAEGRFACAATTATTWWRCPGAWWRTRWWPRSWPPAGSRREPTVTVRVGARTGERMVVVDGRRRAAWGSTRIVVPEGVRVVTGAELAAGKRAWLHEEVAGVRLRVSARSFFQAGPEAAEALVAAVREASARCPTEAHLADLYGGIGPVRRHRRGRARRRGRSRRRPRPPRTPG